MTKCASGFSEANLKKCSFSIDHILNVAGRKSPEESEEFNFPQELQDRSYDWLSCTRYRPPKLPRNRRKDVIQRRKLGRNPRIPFSSSQVALLEAKFHRTPYLSSSDVTQLADYLQLSETRVKIWFQNRRARERRDRDIKMKVSQISTQKEEPLSGTTESIANPTEFPVPEINPPELRAHPFSFYYLANDRLQGRPAFLPSLLPLDLTESSLLCK